MDIGPCEVKVDWIELQEFEFSTIVGILPSERVTVQPLRVDIRLELPLDECGDSGDLSKSLNYAMVEAAVCFLAQEGQWWLIESLALAVCRWLLADPAPGEGRGRVETVEIRLRKPTILHGRAVPGVGMRRTGVVQLAGAQARGVRIQTLVDTGKDAAWRVVLMPGASWSVDRSVGVFVVSGSVWAGDQQLKPNERRCRGTEFEVQNREGAPAVLLFAGMPVT